MGRPLARVGIKIDGGELLASRQPATANDS
jgi:hypothetical protein